MPIEKDKQQCGGPESKQNSDGEQQRYCCQELSEFDGKQADIISLNQKGEEVKPPVIENSVGLVETGFRLS